MSEWVTLGVDGVLILVVGFGIIQAMRLIAQLRDLRSSRVEMDRFVRDFNAAVMRAEAGIKALRATARDSGDDLEKLVEKAVMVRDELTFIVDSADNVAERLSAAASGVMHTDKPAAPSRATAAAPVAPPAAALPPEPPPASRAEKELLQALQKLK